MANIELLKNFPDYTPILAFWAFMEWYRNRAISFNLIIQFYRNCENDNKLPICWVAVEDGIPVGMVTLKKNALWSRKDLNPWLVTLYILPEFRGRGIGVKLINTLIDKSLEMGYKRLYLFTDQNKNYDLCSYYAKRGWRFLGNAMDNDYSDTMIFYYE
ncbi:MAG: GNAT family N-acetyltransferase [Spirochaetota bacterium]|nr:GNAT family N-acetyltransferase [Spirochaetota bacterium]